MLFLPAVAEHYGVSCVPAGGGLTSLKMKALQTPHNIFSRTEPCGENPIVDYHCAKPYRLRRAYHSIFVPVCNTWQVRELVQVHMKASLILLAALARIGFGRMSSRMLPLARIAGRNTKRKIKVREGVVMFV